MSDTRRTAQELFDHVARALIAQGKPSGVSHYDKWSCEYVAADGAMCAAGHCVPPGMRAIEGETWRDQTDELVLAVGHANLVNNLQDAHDSSVKNDVSYGEMLDAWRYRWSRAMRKIALNRELDADVLREIPESWEAAER